jgi:hypothetical protein
MTEKNVNADNNEENIQEIHYPDGTSIKGNHLGKHAEKMRRGQQRAEWWRWLRSVLLIAIVCGLVALANLPACWLAGAAPPIVKDAFREFRKKPT